MVVAHNLTAINANNKLKLSTEKVSESTQKLSSGFRINQAADDAAGLSISEKMRWQIRGLNRCSDNAGDGISVVQIAEGALAQTHDILQRMKELSTQAANDTNTDIDRASIQNEIDSLTSEIDRVASSTQFNTMNLLDGTWSYEEGQQLKVSENLSWSSIESFYTAESTPVGNATASGYTELKNVLKDQIVPNAVSALLDTFPESFKAALDGSSVGIGLNIYSDASSITLASVGMQYLRYSDGTMVSDVLSYTLNVNAAYVSYDSSGKIETSSRTMLENTILHEMTHALMDEYLTSGMAGAKDGKYDASNKFPSWFIEGMAQTAAGGCANSNDWVNGGLRITQNSTIPDIQSAISGNSLTSQTIASKYGTGYLACMYLGALVKNNNNNTSPLSTSAADIADGLDTLMKEIHEGTSLDDVIKNHTNYQGLDDFAAKFGDDASAQFVHNLLVAVGDVGNGSLVGKDYTKADLLSDNSSIQSLFSLDVTNTLVKNKYDSNGYKFTTDAGAYGSRTGNVTPVLDDGTAIPGTVGDMGAAGKGMHIQVGALSGQAIIINIEKMDADELGVKNLKMDSFENAGAAMTSVDAAIDKVSKERAKLGAYMNRLEHTIKNIENISENTSAAESRIRDTDMAKEMVEYSNQSIIAKAGQSMLAQANQANRGVLSLLQM